MIATAYFAPATVLEVQGTSSRLWVVTSRIMSKVVGFYRDNGGSWSPEQVIAQSGTGCTDTLDGIEEPSSAFIRSSRPLTPQPSCPICHRGVTRHPRSK